MGCVSSRRLSRREVNHGVPGPRPVAERCRGIFWYMGLFSERPEIHCAFHEVTSGCGHLVD